MIYMIYTVTVFASYELTELLQIKIMDIPIPKTIIKYIEEMAAREKSYH